MPNFDLGRYVTAQSNTYESALEEVRAGKKRSHWMWFVFPQVSGLGTSDMTAHYAIGSIEEAYAYLAHPILGLRLREVTEAMNARVQSDPALILGSIDAAKFRSSMTLFDSIAPDQTCFRFAIDKFFGGEVDEVTVFRLASWRKLLRAT